MYDREGAVRKFGARRWRLQSEPTNQELPRQLGGRRLVELDGVRRRGLFGRATYRLPWCRPRRGDVSEAGRGDRITKCQLTEWCIRPEQLQQKLCERIRRAVATLHADRQKRARATFAGEDVWGKRVRWAAAGGIFARVGRVGVVAERKGMAARLRRCVTKSEKE